jgi:hypothetical protein
MRTKQQEEDAPKDSNMLEIGEGGPKDSEVEEMYKAYYFERKNREWRMSNAVDDGDDNCKKMGDMKEMEMGDNQDERGSSFPLEMQMKFASVRRKCIQQSKRDRDEMKRMKLASENEKKPAKPVSFANGLPSDHKRIEEKSIPASVARQIIQNIKRRGVSNIDDVRHAVVAEARKVLQLDDEESLKQSYMDNGSNGDDDLFKHDMSEEGKGFIYQHMPIDMIDEFVGWATSFTGNNNIDTSAPHSKMANQGGNDEVEFGLAHEPTAPPPPSQISFLRQKLEAKLMERVKTLYPKETSDNISRRTKQLLNKFDSSALVSVGVAIEEMTAAALIPFAKAHVERCRRHSEARSSSKQGEELCGAWTLPVAEAVSQLSRDTFAENTDAI